MTAVSVLHSMTLAEKDSDGTVHYVTRLLYESMAKQAIVRVFNTIMTRAGITLIVTVAFSISSMFYNISTDYPFFMVAFLQIVCFAGIYMKLGDLMSMFSLNAGDSQSMGRRIFRRPYLFMRHRARRMEHCIANRGMNPNTLQYLMGHANITMTLGYYAHGTFQSAKAELERLAC